MLTEENKNIGMYGAGSQDIHAARKLAVIEHFKNNVGNKALLLLFQFPFLIIGTIIKVRGDFLIIQADVTNVNELDDEIFRVKIDSIEVLYIEKPGKQKIPDIKNRNGHHD